MMVSNGWINSDLFLEMFTEELPIDEPRLRVLLLDGHRSHVHSLDFRLMKAYPSFTLLQKQSKEAKRRVNNPSRSASG